MPKSKPVKITSGAVLVAHAEAPLALYQTLDSQMEYAAEQLVWHSLDFSSAPE